MHPLQDMDVETYESSLKNAPTPENDSRHHNYYQWVPIVLALQSAIYFMPIWLWKQSERGYFEMILCGLQNVSLDGSEANKVRGSILIQINYIKINLFI